MRAITLMVLLGATQVAAAQVGLPAVRLPSLPAVGVPGSAVPGLLSANGQAADLDELRQLRIRELLRRHADALEADPHGDAIVRGQVLLLSPDGAALEAAAAAGFTEVRELSLAPLGMRIVVLHTAGHTARALRTLASRDPAATLDFNHIYLDSGVQVGSSAHAPADGAQPAPGEGAAPPTETHGEAAAAAARVGLIDSGVDADHAAFRGLAIHRHGCAGALVPDSHGTAVASLLVGRDDAFHGAAPGAELDAADVFCGAATGGSVDAVAEAFAWLVGERVPVINVSLVGPANNLLRTVVAAVIARGYLVVAAVGNDGPAAPPLYPAAWPGVIGVTAVDARGRVLAEAERGSQVKFAAPGADMAAARSPQGYVLVRGTSFAAPLVAGLLALELKAPDEAAAHSALTDLAAHADPRGTRGVDPVYGYGLVAVDLRPQPSLVHLRAN
jgi:hypothetical protein